MYSGFAHGICWEYNSISSLQNIYFLYIFFMCLSQTRQTNCEVEKEKCDTDNDTFSLKYHKEM